MAKSSHKTERTLKQDVLKAGLINEKSMNKIMSSNSNDKAKINLRYFRNQNF